MVYQFRPTTGTDVNNGAYACCNDALRGGCAVGQGGKNRRKAVVRLQRQHERITNQRKDFLNKLTHQLVAQYDRIAVEALRITNMVKNRQLAKGYVRIQFE